MKVKSCSLIHFFVQDVVTLFLIFYWLVVNSSSSSQKAQRHPKNRRVLILGAGYVSLPAVEYLAKGQNTEVTVG